MRIVSWNVNGIRSATKKGFLPWLNASEADIVGVQEVRATESQIDASVAKPLDFHTHFSSAKRPGYSGVGLFSRVAFSDLETSLGVEEFDAEGRVQVAHFGPLVVANIYFPNGNGKDHDNSRIPFKLDFYRRLFDVLEPLRRAGRPIFVIGDFNTAHQEIDLARPKENVNTSGFCAVERQELDRWLSSGYVDSFRHFNKEPARYSWWSNRAASRERNVGWRIDYVLASSSAMGFVKNAFIWSHIQGSDHCPVGVDIDKSILSAKH